MSYDVLSLEPATLDQWYVISQLSAVSTDWQQTMLLDCKIRFRRTDRGIIEVQTVQTRADLPVRARYGCVWTTLGEPTRDVPMIVEAGEPDRRLVDCGSIMVRTSGLRIVENFLDMAHFPFVHTNILGAEPHTEVARYTIEMRDDGEEVWATDCRFFQPQAAFSASDGIVTDYVYRVASPFVTLLYKTCPNFEDRNDVIALFVQPMTRECSRAHPVMFLLDDVASDADLTQFQQLIFMQDRIILENQRPRCLPLDPGQEIPTMADRSSVAYRRWLKARGVVYGTVA